MQLPPTSPRRRERLQPELHRCGLGIDGLRGSLQREDGRPVLCPAASGTFSGEEAAEEGTSPNAIEASNTARILASRRLMHWLHGASEQRASLTQETVDILRLGKVFGSIEPDWVYEPR